jgi:hypothetical protein
MELSETTLLQLSRAKDGDVLVVKLQEGDTSNQSDVDFLSEAVRKHCGKKIAVVGIPNDCDLTLLEASEARSILERLTGYKT